MQLGILLVIGIVVAAIDYINFERMMEYYDGLFLRREYFKDTPNSEYRRED